MPSKPYVVDATKLPRQSRFGGMMQETAVLMDDAVLKFSWAKPFSGEMTARTAPEGKPDVHPWDQAILLMKGKVEVILGDDGDMGRFMLEPGYIVYIPANVPHTGRVIGDEECFGLDIFAPVRKDYLDMCEDQLKHERGEESLHGGA